MAKVPVATRIGEQPLQRDLGGNDDVQRGNDDVQNFGSASMVAKVGSPKPLINGNWYYYYYRKMRVGKDDVGLIQEWVQFHGLSYAVR